MENLENLLKNKELVYVLIILIGLIYGNRRRLFGKFGVGRTGSVSESSLVMAFFSQGHGLRRIKRSKIEGVTYNAFLTTSTNLPISEKNTKSGSIVYMLELPFYINGHIIGINKKSKVDRYFLESFLEAHCMKEIVLEGDYPKDFSIYALPSQEVIVRYVLDPKVMGFTIDYCRGYFWEIVADEMYFATVGGIKASGNALSVSLKFANLVRPANASSVNNQKQVKHELPYGDLSGVDLSCPICKKKMITEGKWLSCVEGHGILIPGSNLNDLKKKKIIKTKSDKKPVIHNDLYCPNCGTKMHSMDYLNLNIIIDSCPKCVYRWLDTNEAYKIGQGKKFQ